MSKISAQVIADSLNPYEKRITTMVVTFPRIILAEFNTHRMFSRNSASSRAIPFEKMVESVQTNPFIPIAWQKDHKGMQGTEYFNEGEVFDFPCTDRGTDTNSHKYLWLKARDKAVKFASLLAEHGGLTKQLCNRLLEPFMWHTVIVTASDWENFFALRCPQYEVSSPSGGSYYRSRKDLLKSLDNFPQVQLAVSKRTEVEWLQGNKGQAEIHMMALAEAMWDEYQNSVPLQLKQNQWHIPFIEVIED